jgi:NitT/TauT family transport system substrate-binding protein
VVARENDKVTRVLRVLREAMQFRIDDPDKAIEHTAKLLGTDAARVRADAANSKALPVAELDARTADGTVDKWLTGMNDYFVSAKKLPSAVEPRTYYIGDQFTAAGK